MKSTLVATDFNLSMMERPKSMLNMNNLLTILQYHWALDTNKFPHEWQRVQLVLILLIAVFTALDRVLLLREHTQRTVIRFFATKISNSYSSKIQKWEIVIFL